MMSSPSPKSIETNSNKSHIHHYHSQNSSNISLYPRKNKNHSMQSYSESVKKHQQENRNLFAVHNRSCRFKENNQVLHQSSTETTVVKRVAPMWSPSSDDSAIYCDASANSISEQRNSTRAEIDKLDDLLQELTPRLNDSPSEYSRRRRQSFSNSSKTGTYEGRNRQDTFIQGFSPTSPDEERDRNLLINDLNNEQQMISVSLARAPLVERSNSQTDIDIIHRQAAQHSWHSEEKKRLQRTRSLLDEKDKYLTGQLRRIQARTGIRDVRDLRDIAYRNAMSPFEQRPSSSQKILREMGSRHNNSLAKDYTTISDWEEMGLFPDQKSYGNTRRANSEMDYPFRDTASDRRNSPVVQLASRRRHLRRHHSDRDDFPSVRQKDNSDYQGSRNAANNYSCSPITAYHHPNYDFNGLPSHQDISSDATDDIPLIQRRNIRSNMRTTQMISQNFLHQESASSIKTKDQNIESLPIHIPQTSYVPPSIRTNMHSKNLSFANSNDYERSKSSLEILHRTKISGFQIRNNSSSTTGISYHDPDEVYLSGDNYPLASRLTVSQSPTENHTHNKSHSPHPKNSQTVRLKSEDIHNQTIISKELQNSIQDPNKKRQLHLPPKLSNSHNSQNSSLRKSAKIWYQPTMSREEAVKNLIEKPPGHFFVRQSHTFNNSYGLAVKVPKSTSVVEDDRCIRHFLIESNNKGVRIRGCSNEPYFGSLTALVHQHTLTKLALPCCLILPPLESDIDDQPPLFDNKNNVPKVPSQFTSKTFSALYLGSIDTDSLIGATALNKALEILLENRSQVKQTEVSIRISTDGLTLTDVLRKLFFRRHYPLISIMYCGTDNNSFWESPEIRSRGLTKSKIFGFVAQKTGTSENMCHLLCEWHPQESARSITNFISSCIPGT